MKANEVPEKIFLSCETDEDGYIYIDYMWHRHQFEGMGNIEYTRTDAFIEKATKWLIDNIQNYTDDGMGERSFVLVQDLKEDFKKYME